MKKKKNKKKDILRTIFIIIEKYDINFHLTKFHRKYL